MMNLILHTIFWTFSFYGLYHFFLYIIRSYLQCKVSNKGIYLFVAFKNQEDKIEGFVRYLLYHFLSHPEKINHHIFLMDLNSTDQTAEILNIISKDYPFIHVVQEKDVQKTIDTISETK